MLKKLVFIPIAFALVLLVAQCVNAPKNAPIQEANVEKPAALMTHKEAADTLLLDSTAPIKPLIFAPMTNDQMLAVLKAHRMDSLFVKEYPSPDNGFYGEDRYRIEFIFTECQQDLGDPRIFHVKGKNRHKKVITPFEGKIVFESMRGFIDPNINYEDISDMGIEKMYAAEGSFEMAEDRNAPYSGLFKGKMKIEFSHYEKNNLPQLWYYSQAEIPSGGAGYRFDGTWTNYKKPEMVKPVIWAADIFRFADGILKEFSIGERDVEINPKYRSLGWDNFWENDEWWAEAQKPKM